MKKKISVIISITLAMCLVLTGCGTTLAENTNAFFKEVGEVFDVWFSTDSDDSGNKTVKEESGERLAAVTDFKVSQDGSYSFTGSKDAAYYVITVCDIEAVNDDDTFLYSSSRIDEDGSGTYTGNVLEMFTITYGEYLVKCFAYPEIGDSEYEKSIAVTGELRVDGELDEPQIEYFWNIFDGTLTFQLGNINRYTLTCVPDSVDITVTGEDGTSEVITLEEPSSENTSVSTLNISEGTYTITAVAHSSSEYVTNNDTAEVEVASGIEFSVDNIVSASYSYTNTGLGHGYSWPVGTKTLDPTQTSSLGAYNGTDFVCEPADSTEGTTSNSVYSFTFTMAVGFGEEGWAELYSDGTCAAHNGTSGPVSASSVTGTWYENGDGTITINWNMDSVEITV